MEDKTEMNLEKIVEFDVKYFTNSKGRGLPDTFPLLSEKIARFIEIEAKTEVGKTEEKDCKEAYMIRKFRQRTEEFEDDEEIVYVVVDKINPPKIDEEEIERVKWYKHKIGDNEMEEGFIVCLEDSD